MTDSFHPAAPSSGRTSADAAPNAPSAAGPGDYPDPTPEMLNGDVLFDAIWNAIKGWDISRHNDGLYSGPSGNDARHIYDAIRATWDAALSARELLGAVARGWTHGPNQHKQMDPDLAIAIAAEVSALVAPPLKKQSDDGSPGSESPAAK